MKVYRQLRTQLESLYSPSEADAIARRVMEDVYGLSLTDLLMDKDNALSEEGLTNLTNIVARLLKSEPVQYVTGMTEFCGRTFHVAPGVLIPRPETEELVGLILDETPSAEHTTLLDIGTGSGCIATSLALARPSWEVHACDISQQALAIARSNASRLDANVSFRREDILHPDDTTTRYDIIVSNPPYICTSEAREMEANVLDYEPSLALFVPDDDPLLFYRAIALYGLRHLVPQGAIYFEINRAYGRETADMLASLGYTECTIRRDQFGNDRMLSAHLKQI